MNYKIIHPTADDVQRFWHLMNALDHETEFMLYEPGERSPDLSRVTRLLSQPEAETLVLAAEAGEEMVGFLSADRGSCRRTAHSAYIVCGVREAYRNQGIGTRLFRMLDDWAKINGITRLELTVLTENAAAVHLYRKSGFEIEGTRRHSMRVKGVYKDEYEMSKLISEET